MSRDDYDDIERERLRQRGATTRTAMWLGGLVGLPLAAVIVGVVAVAAVAGFCCCGLPMMLAPSTSPTPAEATGPAAAGPGRTTAPR